MLVYQPSTSCPDQNQLRQMVSFLVQKLYPTAKTLSAPSGAEPVCQLLRTGPLLVEFQFYVQELQEGAFENLLKAAALLEVKRKEQQDISLIDIGICLLAQNFSREFLARLPSSFVRVDLFAWELIRSEEDKSILIRPVRSGIIPERSVPAQAGKSGEELLQDKKVIPIPSSNVPEISTPELIAFARLGMELRNRKAQSNVPFSKHV